MSQGNPSGDHSILLEVYRSNITGERSCTLRHTTFRNCALTDCGLRADAFQKMFGRVSIRTAINVVACGKCLQALRNRCKTLGYVDASGEYTPKWHALYEFNLPGEKTPASNTGVNYGS